MSKVEIPEGWDVIEGGRSDASPEIESSPLVPTVPESSLVVIMNDYFSVLIECLPENEIEDPEDPSDPDTA